MKYVIVAALLATRCAFADPISDAQNISSLYQGTFSVDANNPVSFLIETVIPNQEVELQLTSHPLNTAAFDILSLPSFFAVHEMSSAPLVPVTFAHFQVFINNCNISSQIAHLCNVANCWANNPTVPRPEGLTPQTADLGSDFSMASAVTLNSGVFNYCADSFPGFYDDSQYQVTFVEEATDSCPAQSTGGRVSYRIAVRNFTPTPIRKGR